MPRSDDKIRLFVGVKVSLATVEGLARARKELTAAADAAGLRVRWVAPATYHVTLKFLGWTRFAAVEAIRDSVGRALAGKKGFGFETRSAGAFPTPRKARVVWAGIEDPRERLADLAGAVEEALSDLGYRREKRPFHPHVTLGRLKVPGNVASLLEPFAEQSFSETLADSVILYESVMKSSGAEYSVRAEWPLERPPQGRKRQTERLEPSSTGERTSPGEDTNGPEQGSQ